MIDDLYIPDDFDAAAARRGTAAPETRPVDDLTQDAALAGWARDLLLELAALHGDDVLPPSFPRHTPLPRYLCRGAPEAAWLHRFLTARDIDETVQRAWLRLGFLADDPPWLTTLLTRDEAQITRVFLLSGNVSDYSYDPVVGYRPLPRRLVDALGRAKACVVTVSLARGVTVHARDDAVRRLLHARLDEWGFATRRFDPSAHLTGQVCRLVDALRRWLEDEGDNLPEGVACVFENAHLAIAAEHRSAERNFLVDSLLSWSTSPSLFHGPHSLILMAEYLGDIGDELRSSGGKIDEITVERPATPEARLKFILPLLQSASGMRETRIVRQRHGLRLDGYDGDAVDRMRALAHDTAGLTLLGIEDIAQEALLHPGRALDAQAVMHTKRERLQRESGGLLDVIHPRRTLDDLAGYEPLKRRLREVIRALRRADDPLTRATTPMGLLFLGPPGTGKTAAAEAIARESDINMVRLGDFRDMYVGQSERNLSRLLNLLEAMYPVIVFMDEIDQAEGRGRPDDGGISKRIFGKLLQFMSDTRHRGKILWIGASNRPDAIDEAMKRAGRFDVVLPFLLPDEPSRAQIFSTLLHVRADALPVDIALGEADYRRLAARTEGFSGAEIELLIGEALHRAAQRRHGDERVAVGPDEMTAVLDEFIPPQARREYAEMEALARAEVRFRTLLPDADDPPAP